MDEFNVIADCACCGIRKDNCFENIVKENGEIKVELICKECYEEMQK